MPQYYDLIIRCPACITNGRWSGPASYWYHSTCQGALEIGSNATIRCSRCLSASHVRNWRYSCANHHGDYRSTTSAHFASSVSMSSALLAAGGRQWLLGILDNLDDW